VLTQSHLPWVVSVHDLLVFQHVLDQPEHFLTYLRRRTNRDAAMWITGSDELDILMWYLAGGFYFEPDPERIFAQHPKSNPPTAKQRRGYADQGRTLVGTFTDPLDAHYYWEDGTSSRPADCPGRERMEPALQGIVDSMSASSAPGWWRAAADIDGYSTQAQHGIADNIGRTLVESARDGSFHTFTTGGTDDTGRWIYIFAAGPDTAANREHLRQYLRAKKHQDHADRALGVLMAHDGKPRLTMWLAHEPEEDPELDALAREMRLIPPDRCATQGQESYPIPTESETLSVPTSPGGAPVSRGGPGVAERRSFFSGCRQPGRAPEPRGDTPTRSCGAGANLHGLIAGAPRLPLGREPLASRTPVPGFLLQRSGTGSGGGGGRRSRDAS
jgi:hypothetical protein